MALLELVCALKLHFNNKSSPQRHTHIQTALPPGKWNSWDFNGQLTRWLDLWRRALCPSRQHMLLSAELSYVEGSPLHQPERERENRKIWLELAALVFLCSNCSKEHIKTTRWSPLLRLFLPPAVPVSVRPDWITTNHPPTPCLLSVAAAHGFWRSKHFSQSATDTPPHPHPTHTIVTTHALTTPPSL